MPKEKLELVSEGLAGRLMNSVSIDTGINCGMLYQCVRQPKELKESESEELIRLRAENEHIKTELEVTKRNSLKSRKGSYATQGENEVIVKNLRKEGYKLRYPLKTMELSKSTYYFKISKEGIASKRNEEVLNQIIDIFKANKGKVGAGLR